MKSPFYLNILLPFFIISCSSYQKVSLTNFEAYELNSNDREDLSYILKTHKLHYSDIDRKDNTNFYAGDESTPYYSRSAIFEENIVIPKGATGHCIHSQDDHFIIDFGEGVLVPFSLLNDDNKAKGKIVIEGRTYSLVESNRKGSLHFDTRNLATSE
jgi:hypothetical protein